MARLLCVDDDAELQQLLSLTLQQAGHEVHYAFTGEEGYQRAVALNPDILLLDLQLPKMSGVEVVRRLRGHPAARDMPVVVMTAHAKEYAEDELRLLEIADYLRKPLQLSELMRLVRRILAGRKDRTKPAFSLRKGRVRLDPKFSTVWVDDKLAATLGPKRFQLMLELLQSPGDVARPRLVERLWGEKGDENTLEKTVQRLRESLGSEGERVRTTRKGYELFGG